MAENEKLNNVAVDNDVGTMEDVDAIMKKYDRESNTRVWEGTPRKILRVLTALFGIFLIVMNMWIKMDERARRPLFLGLVIILVFIYYPIKKGSQKVNYMPWYDIVMAAVGAFCFLFYPLNLEKSCLPVRESRRPLSCRSAAFPSPFSSYLQSSAL